MAGRCALRSDGKLTMVEAEKGCCGL